MTSDPRRKLSEPQFGQPTANPSNEERLVVDAQKLLAGQREVWIEHAGVRYCLCLTRRNRLILRK
jgi:hemin uptake protein HemP